MGKLHNHLIASTEPKALKENIVEWRDYRLTILDSGLFRLEKNDKKIFRDKATQIVWFRNMPKQNFTSKEIDSNLHIKTDLCELVITPNREDCYIIINNIKTKIDNAENLMGTYRTLDRFSGDEMIPDWCNTRSDVKRTKIQLGTGVCSKNGVAVFDDSKSLTLDFDGEIKDETGLGSDEYIFAYGKDYRRATKSLYMITGQVPLVPRFALGNWWSRYHDYTDREYLQLLNRFEDHKVPLTVATIDMDWHYSDMKQIDRDFGISENHLNSDEYSIFLKITKIYCKRLKTRI